MYKMVSDDRATYDIFVMFLVLFLCIWKQIIWELEELLMILWTYCIVFNQF